MKKKPIEVILVKKEGGNYKIKFPNLQIPVEVNKELYLKMLHSNEYDFKHHHPLKSRQNSA